MKTILYTLALFTLFSFSTTKENTSSVDWQTDYEKVLKKAKKEKKNVLVYFTGSDWCPPCKMLKKDLFETDAFKQLSSEYVLSLIHI